MWKSDHLYEDLNLIYLNSLNENAKATCLLLKFSDASNHLKDRCNLAKHLQWALLKGCLDFKNSCLQELQKKIIFYSSFIQ